MAQVPLFCSTTAMEMEMNGDGKEKREPVTMMALKESGKSTYTTWTKYFEEGPGT